MASGGGASLRAIGGREAAKQPWICFASAAASVGSLALCGGRWSPRSGAEGKQQGAVAFAQVRVAAHGATGRDDPVGLGQVMGRRGRALSAPVAALTFVCMTLASCRRGLFFTEKGGLRIIILIK